MYKYSVPEILSQFEEQNVQLVEVMTIQHAQRDLARNHSGPTSVKSRKCRRN